jgi:Transcriptional regulator
MNWDDVRFFVALVRHGSLSGAGRELNVEHSTVVRRIDNLEKALGLRLFDRMGRRWVLTTEGEQLWTRAEHMEESAHAFMREANEGAALSGKVRLSAPPAFATAFLAPQLAMNKERWAPITVELVAETRLVSLTRREADLALRLGRPSDPTLATRPVGELRYSLFATREYLDRHASSEWKFVGYDDSLRDTPEQHWLNKYVAGRPYCLLSNSSLALCEAAAQHVGIALLPYLLARRHPALIPIPADPPPPSRELWLVIHPEVRRSARVKLVAELVSELILSAEGALNPQA